MAKTYNQIKKSVLGKSYDINKNSDKAVKTDKTYAEIKAGVKDGKYNFNTVKKELENTIRFDTFASDISSMGKTIEGIRDNWQTQETMQNTRSSIESMQTRLKAYKEYQKLFGKNELPEIKTSYAPILDSWDSLTEHYGKYNDAKSYKAETAKLNELSNLNSSDVEKRMNVATKEAEDLKAKLKKAKEYDKNIKNLTLNSMNIRNPSAVKSFSNTVQKAINERDDYLKSIGYESVDALENALNGKGVAYTTVGGENITWQSLYDSKKQKEESDALYKEISSMDDFAEFRTKGANIVNPTYKDGEKGISIGGWKPFADDIGNVVEYAFDNKDMIALSNMYGSFGDDRILYTLMTPEERAIHNYHLGKEREGLAEEGTAEKYLESIQSVLKDRHENNIISGLVDYTNEHPVLGSAISVWQNIGSGGEYLGDSLKYLATGELDTNHLAKASSAIRGTVSKNVDWEIGNWDAFDFVYNTGMSMVDSTVSMATFGGAGGIALGLSAAAQGTNDALARGLDNRRAFFSGLSAGVFEGLFETYSIGKFKALKEMPVDGVKSVIKNVGKSMLTNASEETLTELANVAYDTIVNGDLSQAKTDIRAYINSGMSEEDAIKKVALEQAGRVVEAGASGALMGVGFGGIASGASYLDAKSMGQTIKSNERVGDMFEIASTSPEVSSAYEAYTRYANKGINAENISDAKLGNLYSSVKADAKEVLESKKSTEEQKTEALKTLARLSDVTTENTVAKEKKKLKVGEETKVNESDSAVDIQSFRVEGENVIATTEKGEISVDDMTLSNADADIVAHAKVVSQTDGEDVANLFVSQYDGKTNIEEYSNSFELVSTLSKIESYTDEQIFEAKGVLSTTQAKEIYKVTRIAQEKANKQAREQAFEKMRAMMGKQGVIDDSVISYDNKATKGQVNWKDLGYRQRKAITFANGLFTAMGSNVVWTNKDKSNGMYSIEGDTIFIDVYAGVNLNKLIGKDSIINTISHELTHQMEVHSPETFNEVKELVLDALEKVAKATDKSVKRSDLIENEIKRLDKKHPEQKHTEADAISELVAKACEEMLSESKKGIELFNSLSKAEQKTLTEKIKDIISKLKNWITDLLKTYSSNSEEAKALRSMQDTFDEVLKRWDKMLADVAEQNKARKESGAVEKETSAEKRVLEQAREIDSDGNSYWQIETDKDIFKGIETVKGLQDAAYNYILNGDKGDKITDLIDGKELNFIRVSAKEYVYGEASKTLSTEEYKQKMRMSTSIIDLIENASIEYDAPDHKSHKMFPDGFKNYQGRVGIDETIFKYIVRVGKSKDGMIFYDINLEVDGKVPRANRTSLIKSSTSNNSISNPDKKVNTKSSKVLNEGKVLNADRDAEYLELAKDPVKNEARLREMVYEAAKEKGYTDDSSWRMGHTAPNSKDDISLDNLKESGLIPDDFWEHPEWYTHSYEERESYYKVKKAIELQETRNANGVDRPAHMWVYRAVDKTKNKREDYFRNGDWVTPSKEYAINEGKMNPNGYRIIKHSVSIKNLYWDGNSIAELGYDDGNNYAYADTLNNRKLLDPVTYYPSGEIIPLSKRFNRRDYDVKFSDRDTEYLNAVEKGDVETASKLIEEAAERVFSNSKVRGSDGKLRLVYHGTVNDFTVFKRQFANIEGDFGKGYYFTSNEYDVDANYANEEGPDLKIKIAKYAEQLEWDDEYADLSYEEREEIARQKFITSEPTTITAYLNMENPVYITPDENGTLLDYNESYDEEYDEYGEPEGLLIDFIEALQNNATDYAYRDVDFSFLYEYAYDNGGVYASDAVKIIKERIVDELMDESGELAVNEVIRLAFEEIGFDGIIDTSVYYKFRNMDGMDSGTTHYIVFDSEQIKSADIATYDDNGNVIPLSQRFDFSNEDIRYSDREDTSIYDIMGETDRILKENEKLKADVERLNERLKIERKVTKGNYFNANQLGAVAGHLRNISNSTIDKVELMKSLKDVYSFIAESSEVITEELFEKCYRIADAMIENAKPEVIVDDYYKMILSDIRNTRISLSESQKKEAQNIFDKNWNRYFFGNVIITDKGIGLESKWQEWASQYPGVFDAEISDGDMVGELYNIITTLREASETVVEYNEEERKVWLANEIYNQYWNVSPIKTTADKYNERIKQLNFEHRKAMAELRNDYKARLEAQKLADDIHYGKKVSEVRNKRAEVEEQRKADREKFQKLYKAIRERKDKEIALAKQHGRERMEKYKENAERKTILQSLMATVMSLNKKLVTNSKDVHIPESLKPVVTNLLNSIDFSSKQLLDDGMPTKSDISTENALNKVRSMASEESNIVSLKTAIQDALELFENAEKVLREASDGTVDSGVVALDVDMVKDIKNMIRDLDILEKNGDSTFIMQKMSVDHLKILNATVKSINHWAIVADKSLKNKHRNRITVRSMQNIDEMDALGERQEYIEALEELKAFFTWNQALPINVFKRLGPAAMEFYDDLLDSQGQCTFNRQEVTNFTEKLFKKYGLKNIKKWRTDVKTFNIKLPGEAEVTKVSMPVSFIMTLHCVAKQEDAQRHLYGKDVNGEKLTYKDEKGKVHDGGGMTIKGYKDGKLKLKVNKSLDNTIINADIVKQITSVLTKEQIEVADALQKYMNDKGSEWGNAVSMALYGIEKFAVKDYFPLKVSPHTLNADKIRDEKISLFSILNYGFTKERNPNAKNSIEIADIFEVFANHMNMMAIYNAYALSIYDVARWLNFKGKTDKGGNISVTQSIEKAFGKGALTYVNNLIKDLNGQHISSRLGFMGKMANRTKVAMVGNSASVALLQPTAYIKAMIKVSPIYLTKAVALPHLVKRGVERAQEHSGLALLKSQGYFETGVSASATTKMLHDESFMEKRRENSLWGAEKADKLTWGVLWNACEFEIRAKRKDLKVGSDEYFKAVSQKLDEVICETQVVDSPLTKSDLMRSPDNKAKELTQFASELTVAYNIVFECIYETVLDAKRMGRDGKLNMKGALKKNAKNITLSLTAYTLTSAVGAVLSTMINDFRYDDDEDEESFFKRFKTNFLLDLLIVGKIPYFKDAVSLLQGYDTARTETMPLVSAVKAIEYYKKAVEQENKKSEAKTEKGIANAEKWKEIYEDLSVDEVLKSASYTIGYGIYNQWRDLRGLLKLIGIMD